MKRLRIIICVVFALLSLFVHGLWIRSHWVSDDLTWNGGYRFSVGSDHGRIRVLVGPAFTSDPLLRWMSGMTWMPDGIGRWHFQWSHQQVLVAFPHRLPVLVFMLLTALPWIHWRYSLRSVLIAVTIVAVVLGLLFAL